MFRASRGFRSRNPLMSRMPHGAVSTSGAQASYGTFLFKLTLLAGVMVLAGAFAMGTILESESIPGGIVLLIAAPIIAFISVIVAMRSVRLAPYFGFLYAAMQGLFLGTISGIYELIAGDGIVVTALLGTAGVFVAMLILFRSGIIRVTDMFRRVMFMALLGIIFSSLFLFVLSLLGLFGEMAFGFYFVIVIISVIVASLYLVIDFDNIQTLIDSGADQRYEWMYALSLLVTVVWLYVELLRLLLILSQRRR